jgi:methyltransferase-like protein
MKETYKKSDSIAIKNVHEETVVFIMDSWSGNLEDEIFILNETGEFILDHMDGIKTVKEISEKLFSEIEGEDISQEEIDRDVISFTEELLKRHIIKLS